MNLRSISAICVVFALLPCSGCASKPAPDTYPAGTAVTLQVAGKTFTLGPRSCKLFLDMLAQQPVASDIGSMSAVPLGIFEVAGVRYDWHGNAVIRRSDNGPERLWQGPYLQRLITERARTGYNADAIQQNLDDLEKDPDVAQTTVEGPGAYPGGGDALHPVRPDDPKGWGEFKPSQPPAVKK